MNKLAQKVKRAQVSVGVDVGQHGMRIVGVTGRDNNLTLNRMALAERGDTENVAHSLHNIWKGFAHTSRAVKGNLGSVGVLVQQVEFPEMEEDSLISAARIEAEQLIPDFHQMAIDYQIIGRGEQDEKGTQPIRVLIVAAPESAVIERLNLFNHAGIDVQSITPDGIALANAVQTLHPPTGGATIAVDIGDTATNLVAITPQHKAIAPIVRFIPGGVSNLSQAGASGDRQGARERQASGERWLREVERSILFVSDRLDAPAEEILVVGDGAADEGLISWIGQAIQMTVKPWNPLGNLIRGIGVPEEMVNDNNGYQCAVALGLALMDG